MYARSTGSSHAARLGWATAGNASGFTCYPLLSCIPADVWTDTGHACILKGSLSKTPHPALAASCLFSSFNLTRNISLAGELRRVSEGEGISFCPEMSKKTVCSLSIACCMIIGSNGTVFLRLDSRTVLWKLGSSLLTACGTCLPRGSGKQLHCGEN